MKEAFEEIKKLLSEKGTQQYEYVPILHETVLGRKIIAVERAMEIVSEVEAEYGNGKTNADRIRAMSDEELAEFLVNFKNTFGEEYEGIMSCLDWLKSPTND